MLFIIKDMGEQKAYKLFTIAHLPLYSILLFSIMSQHQFITAIIIDGFLIAHSVLHIVFERNASNKLKSKYSRNIIHSMGLISLGHLVLILSNH